jgi:tetratricopeptide (TPR) repeat protein
MKNLAKNLFVFATLVLSPVTVGYASTKAKAWEGTLTIPTYPWQEDINPKFWALEGTARGATTLKGAIIYPYTMQDHLSRTVVDRTYKALFIENEYLKVTCLPELGGRLHSVLDKTTGEEMFHKNAVIKPGMIAMRGAWISGGVEWNSGPQGHTVTILSPVSALVGTSSDGAAYIEISNTEKIFRTRWTVRVTLHPAKAYLDERIRIFNPVDAMSPYYFWNCTAFPNRPGTRFIYPMSLAMDHSATKFFTWPMNDNKDISWLKNHDTWASIFAYNCEFDFFGAYDVDRDYGLVQAADYHELSGKKAWTWGTWDFGLVAQQSLTDQDGPYIEVQSGPLPTQSDYGMLWPGQEVTWQEWWYPVHGLGDGFEFATKDVAVQTARKNDRLELRILATGNWPRAFCTVWHANKQLFKKQVDLNPYQPQVLTACPVPPAAPVTVTVKASNGDVLASFVSPLPVPAVSAPKLAEDKPDAELTVEQRYLKGLKYDRATDRQQARRYYEMALELDPVYLPALRGLAVLDVEAGLYDKAVHRLTKALERTPNDDGLSWYFLGVSHLRPGQETQALDCAYRAVRCFGTTALGYDLAGRAYMRLRKPEKALVAFEKALAANPADTRTQDHILLARSRCAGMGQARQLREQAKHRIAQNPTDLVPRAVLALASDSNMERFAQQLSRRAGIGQNDFEIVEASLVFADVGLLDEAVRLLSSTYLKIPKAQRSPLPLYYLAYFCSLKGDEAAARDYLGRAGRIYTDGVFASRPEAVDVLKYAVSKNPADAYAHLHLGNLYAHLGRIDEAVAHWTKAAELNSSLSVALRNLGLYNWADNNLSKAGEFYAKAIAARPDDQTLYRDLAEILIADAKRPEAIKLLESMPVEGKRRTDVIITLAQAYADEHRYTEAIDLLESTPYFVNWEGQRITWVIFNNSHIERGKNLFQQGNFEAALKDFQAALTYPDNLGVGRWDTPDEAPAYYWLGKTLHALGRIEQARSAWKAGADSHEGSEEQNKHRQLCLTALTTAE